MAQADLELVPLVDDDGALCGVLTERELARRYVRESRRTSTLEDAPTYVSAVAAVLEGELLTGEDRPLSGRVWVQSMDARTDQTGIADGDVVVVGDRPDAQLLAIERGAALVILSNSAQSRVIRSWPAPASARRRSSAHRSTATSRAGWSRSRRPAAR